MKKMMIIALSIVLSVTSITPAFAEEVIPDEVIEICEEEVIEEESEEVFKSDLCEEPVMELCEEQITGPEDSLDETAFSFDDDSISDNDIDIIPMTWDYPTGYIPSDNSEEITGCQINSDLAKDKKEALCSSYDSRNYGYITPVKNQGDYGTCWAFASIACMETSLIKNGYADNSIDLSELALAYAAYQVTDADPLHNIGKEGYQPFRNNILNSGGNGFMAKDTFSAWDGIAYESEMPYSSASNYQSQVDDYKYLRNTDIHCTETTFCKADDIESIKAGIMRFGSGSLGYYSSGYSIICHKNISPDYYTTSYVDFDMPANHEVQVIGWDDNFNKNYFLGDYKKGGSPRPSENGAWLCKNSYGENFGINGGYFWLSYYSKGNDTVMFFNAEKDDDDYLYAYTVNVGSNYYGYNHGDTNYSDAVIYYENTSDETVALSKVYVDCANSADISGEIYLDPEFKFGLVQPGNFGTKVSAIQTTRVTGIGIHALSIADTVYVDPGQTFLVRLHGNLIDDTNSLFSNQFTLGFAYNEPNSMVIDAICENTRSYIMTEDCRSYSADRAHTDMAIRVSATSAGRYLDKTLVGISAKYLINKPSIGDSICSDDIAVYGKYDATLPDGSHKMIYSKLTGWQINKTIIDSEDTTIIVSYDGFSSSIDIKAKKQTMYYQGNTYNLSLVKGSTITIRELSCKKGDKSYKIQMSKSDKKFVCINKKGVIKAKKSGTALIDVITSEGTYTVNISVYAPSFKKKTYYINSVDSLDLEFDNCSFDTTYRVLGKNKNNVSVNEAGIVSAPVSSGKPYSVKVEANVCGVTYKCTVKVLNPAIKGKSMAKAGSKLSLKVVNGYGKTTWNSNDTSVASVDSKGRVSLLQPGMAEITAANNGKTLTHPITVS